MAEGILRHRMEAGDIYSIDVTSMGVSGLDHLPATEPAIQVCEEHGIDISAHRSRPIIGEEIQDADWVFCMEPGQQNFLNTFYPWHKDQIVLLAAWPEKPSRKSIVPDPYGRPIDFYRDVFDQITGHIDRIFDEI
jgi:protein-tyrosine phosphatase